LHTLFPAGRRLAGAEKLAVFAFLLNDYKRWR
jgi:hypothetical protein